MRVGGAVVVVALTACIGCRANFDALPDAQDGSPGVPSLSVQGGFVNMVIPDTLIEVMITPVDPARSVLTYSLEVEVTGGGDDVRIGGRLLADRIQFERFGTSENVRIRWYVTTWPAMTVRRGSTRLPAGKLVVSEVIDPPVDPTHSYVVATVHGNGATFNGEDFVRIELETGGMLRCTTELANGTEAVIEWQLVTIPSATVQHGMVPLASGELARTISISPFVLDRSFFVYTQSVAGPTNAFADNRFVRGFPDANNTLRFDRFGGVASQTIAWSVIELAGARVQHGSAAFGAADSELTIAIDPVDPQRAVPFGGGFGGTSGRTSDATGTSPTSAWGTLDLLGPQLVLRRRGINAAADLPWQVIDMP